MLRTSFAQLDFFSLASAPYSEGETKGLPRSAANAYPRLFKGTHATLNENDVWEISPTLQSEPVFRKFSHYRSELSVSSKL